MCIHNKVVVLQRDLTVNYIRFSLCMWHMGMQCMPAVLSKGGAECFTTAY